MKSNSEYQNKQYHLNREDRCMKARKRYKQNPIAKRKCILKKWYGITLEDYDKMFEAQKGLCAICGNPETVKRKNDTAIRRLAIDHDHRTGKIRGLLCGDCNVGLGKFKDSANIIDKAAKYLFTHEVHSSNNSSD